jgi:hypothetical protein
MNEILDIPEGLQEAVCEAAEEADGLDTLLDAEDLNESLRTEEDTHPWSGWTWGHSLTTKCTYPQTLESPAEYETFGCVWIEYDNKTVVEWDAAQLW